MRKVDCGNGVVLYAVNGYHWYKHEPTGTWMRSVTRLTKHYPAGEGLDRWKCSFPNYDMMKDALREAGIRGTAVHEGVVDLVEGRGLKRSQFSPEQWKHLQSFVRWYEDLKPDIHFTEEIVFSLRRKLAGTLDIRATIDGLHTIVDIKTSSAIYRNHVIQAQAYALLFNEGNDDKIEKVAVLRTGSRHKCGYEYKTYDLCPRTAKIFTCLHFIDYDLDNSDEPNFPKESPAELTL